MTHDFHSLVKRWPAFLAALRIMLAFIMDAVKFTCVLFIVLCSYIMDAALRVDWHKVYSFVNDKRIELNKQFVYA
jgi:hypothetical protein|tara:strand:+ start:193 stop:417 length:225 start_codon:yes stop_codon:yes gene_type:complete